MWVDRSRNEEPQPTSFDEGDIAGTGHLRTVKPSPGV